jgi:hypothetical protein
MENRRHCKLLVISVRGLIVLVLVVGTGLGWTVGSAHIQRDAVAAIRQAGGNAFYEWEFKDLRRTRVSDAGLVHLKGLIESLGHRSRAVPHPSPLPQGEGASIAQQSTASLDAHVGITEDLFSPVRRHPHQGRIHRSPHHHKKRDDSPENRQENQG